MHPSTRTYRRQHPELGTLVACRGGQLNIRRGVRLAAIARRLDDMAMHQLAGVRDELEGAALAMEAKLVIVQIPFRRALCRFEPAQRQPFHATYDT